MNMGKGLESWREKILEKMEELGESMEDTVLCTLLDEELDVEFDPGYGYFQGFQGKPFRLWTENYIYFSYGYDGPEEILALPRNPSSEIVKNHIGDGEK